MTKNPSQSERLRQIDSPFVMPVMSGLLQAEQFNRSGRGRFAAYDAMEELYKVFLLLKERRILKQAKRAVRTALTIPSRKSVSIMRVLVEATLPDADAKQKSRWSRALDYIRSEHVSPDKFARFVRAHGGLAGCARLAARHNRKRVKSSLLGDWGGDQ